ncbi:MAG: sulfocyanin-like copper-binding protein [Acetobacteraceae bacterium]
MPARGVAAMSLALAIGTFTGQAMADSTSSPTVATTASAATIVDVVLGDPTSSPSLAAMMLVAKPNSVTSGRVTFTIRNTSTTSEHELLVVKIPGNQERRRLPYDSISGKVIESQIDKVGDSGDLRANTSTTFTVSLTPGRYLLMCNEPGHYREGMWSWLTVDRAARSPQDARK